MRRNKAYIRWALPVWIILVAVLLLTSCAPESTLEPIMTTEPEPAATASPIPSSETWNWYEDEDDMPYVIVTPKPQAPRPGSGKPFDYGASYSASSLAMEIFDLTNGVREENGLCRLAYAEDLQDAADTRAYECSIQFSHTRPDGSSCHDIVTKDYYVTGENLVLVDKPIATAENIMSRWMVSKGHRDNILLPEFTELAVGVYEHRGRIYAAQIFLGE